MHPPRLVQRDFVSISMFHVSIYSAFPRDAPTKTNIAGREINDKSTTLVREDFG
jgi:hypothetical protein